MLEQEAKKLEIDLEQEARRQEEKLKLEARKLDLKAELVKQRLAANIASIHEDERESLPDEHPLLDHRDMVNDWLQQQPLKAEPEPTRAEPLYAQERRRRSPSPEGRVDIAMLTELRKLNQPRPQRMPDLPAFSGAPIDWLQFKAAVRDAA